MRDGSSNARRKGIAGWAGTCAGACVYDTAARQRLYTIVYGSVRDREGWGKGVGGRKITCSVSKKPRSFPDPAVSISVLVVVSPALFLPTLSFAQKLPGAKARNLDLSHADPAVSISVLVVVSPPFLTNATIRPKAIATTATHAGGGVTLSGSDT